FGGIGYAISKMAFGNKLGVAIVTDEDVYGMNTGSIIVEANETILDDHFTLLGIINDSKEIVINDEKVSVEDALCAWTKRYDKVYPMIVDKNKDVVPTPLTDKKVPQSKVQVEKPVVVIPVFPGQNCEYDTTQKFERAGGEVHQVVFNNLTVENIQKSIDTLASEIEKAQILMIVGGFSSGDEPDGSGKFIANVLRNPKISSAISTMRANDGLILGICNGFQALIKSGLLPYGDVELLDANNPTLFRNNINRHVSHIARTRITSNASPWLAGMEAGAIHSIAMSHGEGKFVASEDVLKKLLENGQIATQYVNERGIPTMDGLDNINGSSMAIEGIFSEDGKIFGKMGHSERYEDGLFKNIAGNKDQNIFENGIRYFTHK
ncbi:MAG: phosphoribosylformylglycinamidine synthase subunit PurQ, partial [Holdemanella sp.]|nr:phosphoribosylformylglycinamidine synthase subunit PurQ [Holdemanella sp.]